MSDPQLVAFTQAQVERIGKLLKAFESGQLYGPVTEADRVKGSPVESYIAKTVGTITPATIPSSGGNGSGIIGLPIPGSGTVDVMGWDGTDWTAWFRGDVLNQGCKIDPNTWIQLFRDPYSGKYFVNTFCQTGQYGSGTGTSSGSGSGTGTSSGSGSGSGTSSGTGTGSGSGTGTGTGTGTGSGTGSGGCFPCCTNGSGVHVITQCSQFHYNVAGWTPSGFGATPYPPLNGTAVNFGLHSGFAGGCLFEDAGGDAGYYFTISILSDCSIHVALQAGYAGTTICSGDCTLSAGTCSGTMSCTGGSTSYIVALL